MSTGVAARHLKHDSGSEREACERVWEFRVALAKPAERYLRVICLPGSVAVFTVAEVDTSVVESKDHRAGASEATGDAIHDLVVHRATELWVWMAHQDSFARFVVLRLFKESFELADGPAIM